MQFFQVNWQTWSEGNFFILINFLVLTILKIILLRKNGLMLSNILVFIVGILNIISKYIESYETLIVGRFISGIYCGLFTGILPIYLMEVTPNHLKGVAGSLIGIAIAMGLFTSSFLAIPEILGTDNLWPLIAGFIFIPGLFNVALSEASESPKWLYINCDDKLGAERSTKTSVNYSFTLLNSNKFLFLLGLIKLRGPDSMNSIKDELDEYEKNISEIEQTREVFWKDFLSLTLFKPLVSINI